MKYITPLIMNYQELASRTLVKSIDFTLTDDELLLLWNAIGVAGEAGEVAELAKKQIWHRHGIDKDAWKKELGDILWYIAACCTVLGLTMDEVMEHNINKLKARYPDGFDFDRTKFREGMAE